MELFYSNKRNIERLERTYGIQLDRRYRIPAGGLTGRNSIAVHIRNRIINFLTVCRDEVETRCYPTTGTTFPSYRNDIASSQTGVFREMLETLPTLNDKNFRWDDYFQLNSNLMRHWNRCGIEGIPLSVRSYLGNYIGDFYDIKNAVIPLEVEFSLDFTKSTDGWVNDSSCWWYDRDPSRYNLLKIGGMGVRIYKAIDPSTPIARMWIIPKRGQIYCFNSYSNFGSVITKGATTEHMTYLLTQILPFDYSLPAKIRLANNYINGAGSTRVLSHNITLEENYFSARRNEGMYSYLPSYHNIKTEDLIRTNQRIYAFEAWNNRHTPGETFIRAGTKSDICLSGFPNMRIIQTFRTKIAANIKTYLEHPSIIERYWRTYNSQQRRNENYKNRYADWKPREDELPAYKAAQEIENDGYFRYLRHGGYKRLEVLMTALRDGHISNNSVYCKSKADRLLK